MIDTPIILSPLATHWRQDSFVLIKIAVHAASSTQPLSCTPRISAAAGLTGNWCTIGDAFIRELLVVAIFPPSAVGAPFSCFPMHWMLSNNTTSRATQASKAIERLASAIVRVI